ncbi:hypothetical protein BGZ98_009308, partial [Dissophora globulifera]
MFAKPLNFIAPLAVLLVACMTVKAEVMPQWCTCDDATHVVCNYGGVPGTKDVYGVWDGHTCRLDSDSQYYGFGNECRNGHKKTPVCWH